MIAAVIAALRTARATTAQMIARRPALTATAIVWLLCVGGFVIRGGPLL